MDCKRTGKFIYEMRVRKGFTQKELADKLNITDRAVSKWERGLGIPDVSLLNELSLVLDVSVSEILNGEKFDDKFSSKVIFPLNDNKVSNILMLLLVCLPITLIFILAIYFEVNLSYIFIVIFALFVGLLLFLKKCNNKSLKFSINYLFLIIYTVFLFIGSFYTWFLYYFNMGTTTNFSFNFIPFIEIFNNIKMVIDGVQPISYIFNYVVVDLCMFVPYAVLVPILLGEKFNKKKFLVVILMIIFIRKVLQGVTGIGVFDINDVILNYLGVIVALMISRKILTNN